MNTTIKLGIASALALGATAANAQQIATPNTGSSTVVLFAEVLNSSDAEVASYAANTGISVASAFAGTTATYTGSTALASLFAADAPGDTLVWAVEGSAYTGTASQQATAGQGKIVTTSVNPAQIPTTTYAALNSINAGLSNIISSVNANLTAPGANTNGTEIESAAAASGGVWDASNAGTLTALGGISTPIQYAGTAQTVNLYSLTGPGSKVAPLAATTNGTVTFSAAGLVFANGSPPPPVPLPPAVWLLGSGLLGLAGVARRKAK